MVLILSADEIRGLVTMEDAINITETIVREEIAGTTVHMAPFGGQNARPRGLPPAKGSGTGAGNSGVLRAVGGAAYGLKRVGIRAGGVTLLYDTDGNQLLSLLSSSASVLRISACVALAARHLSRPESRKIGLLGSGRLALPSLEGLCAVRTIDEVAVFSPNAEHRESFAKKATDALGVQVVPVASAAAATDGADIIAVVTVATHPALTADLVAPGTHVTSIGEPHEVDESVYLRANQIVASSVYQEMNAINPAGQRISQRQGLGVPPLWQLLADGRLEKGSVIELGDIVAGNIPARNGASDINVFRESQGGVGDIALASLAYARARALGRGTEVAM